MPIIEAVGWIALSWASHTAIPVSAAVDAWNNRFVHRVDAGRSCWDRIGGTVGEYGSPENYTLDLACNYRLESYTEEDTVTKWRLIRSD